MAGSTVHRSTDRPPGAPPNTSRSWINQDNFCRTTSSRAYLAVPDDATELTNLHALAGGTFWAGIHDTITEGTFVKLPANTAATFLPWAAGQPDNVGGEDCVAAASTTFSDAMCQAFLPAVCECEP
jgi:hypothetical protein